MDYTEFLNTSYTAFHATANSVKMLEEAGFTRLSRIDKWNIQAGGSYYLTVNDSAFIAFRIGKAQGALTLACAHTDSPALKVKGQALLDSPQGKRINVEAYGGAILRSFYDIPLKVAGRVFTQENGKIRSRLVTSSYTVNVPSLCVHHDPSRGNAEPSVQFDMAPLLGNAEDVYSSLGLADVLDADLFVVPAVQAFESGVEGENISSPRIDDLTSVYACVRSLVEAQPNGVAVVACFDNEEIGSNTKQGASSAFLQETVQRIYDAIGEYLPAACENGLALSLDNGHATHPAHAEKSDPLARTLLGGGVMIKHHSNYATDGYSSALVKSLLRSHDIPYQDYYNHSDVRCGGTIGLLVSRALVIPTVDVGLAQLAMHSAVETAAKKDIESIRRLLCAAFER